MLSNTQLKFLLIFIGLMIATTSGYFSVVGLSSIFGNSLYIIIMSSLLEISKVISVSFISSIYFNSLNKFLKYYIILVTIILMLITSFGVYGYLSSNFQKIDNSLNESRLKLQSIDFIISENTKNLEYLKESNIRLQKSIDDINKVVDRTNNSALGYISEKNYNRMLNSLNKNSEKSLNQIKLLNNEIILNNNKINNINDTLLLYNNNKNKINLILNSNSDISTLKFISGLLKVEYNSIVNFLILIIVISFDPLAISLLISANYIKNETKELIKEETIKEETIKEETIKEELIEQIQEEIKEDVKVEDIVDNSIKEEINDVYGDLEILQKKKTNNRKTNSSKIVGELNDYNFIK